MTASSSSYSGAVSIANTSSIETTAVSSVAEIDPYAGWKDYSKSEWGISFKYPSDWTLSEFDYSQSKRIDFTTPAETKLYLEFVPWQEIYYDGQYTDVVDFSVFAEDRLLSTCAVQFNGCKSPAKSRSQFVTQSGISGYEYYFEYEDWSDRNNRPLGRLETPIVIERGPLRHRCAQLQPRVWCASHV